MAKPPVLKPREVVALLENWDSSRSASEAPTGSIGHSDGRGTTVPFHQGRDIAPTLLRQIAKDIGLSVEDFLAAHSTQESDVARPASTGERKASQKPTANTRGQRNDVDV